MSDERDGSPSDAGGDPACWVHRLCVQCGAVPIPEAPDRCWRCGAPLGDALARPFLPDANEP